MGRIKTAGARLPGGRRMAPIVGLVAVAVAVVVVVILSGGSSGGSAGAAAAAGSTSTGAATVEWRDLVATDTETGTLSYADSQTVYNRLNGTITWLPKVGQVIDPGQALYTVDEQPVILLSGRTPAYRDLTASDGNGPDVYELNANLVKLGYNPDGIVLDDHWQAATTAGVEALQKHLGEIETGSLALGDVVFLPGPQLISAQETTVGSTGGSSSSVSDTDPPAAHAELVSLTDGDHDVTTTATTPTTTSPSSSHTPSTSQELAALIALLKAEIAELNQSRKEPGTSPSNSGSPSDSGNGSPSSGNGSDGDSGGSATAILETTSTRLVVTVDLNPSLQYEAKVGRTVSVELPNGTTVGGRVTAISAVASSSSNSDDDNGGGSGNAPTVPVTITLDRPAQGGGLDQAAVSVIFSQHKATHVLSVPVTALLATSGSSFAVQEATAPHRLIPVSTGLYAAGYVEISGNGIHPGLRVTDSQG